jgi:hypothetical protein
MSTVEALTYVTEKRIASRNNRNFDEKCVRHGPGDVIPQDTERTQTEASPETKRSYQEVLSCLFTR